MGNSCAVVELDVWQSDAQLLSITQGLGQPVTSFVVQAEGRFHIRWFSQQSEINLCGHGSLGAGAAVLAKNNQSEVHFHSQYGEVLIAKQGDNFAISLPAWQAQPCGVPEQISALAKQAIAVFSTRDLVLVLPDEHAVKTFQPDNQKFMLLEGYHALIVTAKAGSAEYVLRYFAPSIGIDEDLATGSAHCSLAPYWFKTLGLNALTARQLSGTGGYFKLNKVSDSLIELGALLQRTSSAENVII